MRHIVELLESHCHHSTTTTTLQPVKMTCLILPITNSSKTFTWWPRGDSSASLRSRSVKGGSRKKVYGRPFHIYSWAGSIHPSIQLTGWETPRLQLALLLLLLLLPFLCYFSAIWRIVKKVLLFYSQLGRASMRVKITTTAIHGAKSH